MVRLIRRVLRVLPLRWIAAAILAFIAFWAIVAALMTAVAVLVARLLRRGAPRRLDGRVVVITGSSRGLGLALAEECARRGGRVVLNARRADELEEARQRIASFGPEPLAVVCDVRDREQARRLIERATERFGRVDALINNAGVISVGPLEAQTLDDFRDAMDTMYWGTVYTTTAVLPQMRARREGDIVNITSIGGKVSVPHLLPYNGAKFAAVGFSEGLHAEVSKDGINVLTVVPGLMRTGSPERALFRGDPEAEHTWFDLAASLPVTSTSAERAARLIVDAMLRRKTELIITPQAQVAARVHGSFPGAVVRMASVANRVLPHSDRSDIARRGYESGTALTESALASQGREAERRWNQD